MPPPLLPSVGSTWWANRRDGADFALGLQAAYGTPKRAHALRLGGCWFGLPRDVTSRSFIALIFSDPPVSGAQPGGVSVPKASAPGAAAQAALAGYASRRKVPGLGKVHVAEGGLDAVPQASISMPRGGNVGKQVVKLLR